MSDARDRLADDLEADGQLELANDVRAGRCACGCKTPIATRSGRTLYFDARHRQRAYRRRLQAAAKAAGIEPNLTLETVRATRSTHNRHGDAQTSAQAPQTRPPRKPRAPRPGVSVYLPRPDVAEVMLGVMAGTFTVGDTADDERAAIADALKALEKALARRARRDA